MAALNRGAMEAARAVGVNVSTDVTGYGLLGHLYEMAVASGVEADIDAEAVPVLLHQRVRELAEAKVVPGGSTRNLAFAQPHTTFGDDVDEVSRVILADAQTSGGLLLSVPEERVDALLVALAAQGTLAAAVVGRLRTGEPGRIHVS
jgi:selenide,water dikinase